MQKTANILRAALIISALFTTTPLAAREIPVSQVMHNNQIHVARLEDEGDDLLSQFSWRFRHITPIDLNRYLVSEHDIAKEMSKSELIQWGYPKQIEGVPFELPTVAEILAQNYGVSQYDPNVPEITRLVLKTGITELNRIEAERKLHYFRNMGYTPEQVEELLWGELVIDQFDTRMFRRKELNITGAYPTEYFKGEVKKFVKWNWTSEALAEASSMGRYLTSRFNPKTMRRPVRQRLCIVKMARIHH